MACQEARQRGAQGLGFRERRAFARQALGVVKAELVQELEALGEAQALDFSAQASRGLLLAEA